jgi:hypothetical protein
MVIKQMKFILKLTAMLLFISIAGCGEQDKQVRGSDPVELKSQREALNKAKQLERTLQNEAVQQRETIDESTNNPEQ